MKTFLAALVLVSLVGCTHTSYSDKDGNKFTRTSFGTTQNIGRISASTDGTKKSLDVEGYTNDQAQVASAVVGAAVSAAVKGAK